MGELIDNLGCNVLYGFVFFPVGDRELYSISLLGKVTDGAGYNDKKSGLI